MNNNLISKHKDKIETKEKGTIYISFGNLKKGSLQKIK